MDWGQVGGARGAMEDKSGGGNIVGLRRNPAGLWFLGQELFQACSC